MLRYIQFINPIEQEMEQNWRKRISRYLFFFLAAFVGSLLSWDNQY